MKRTRPKQIININKHIIAKNLKHGTNEPPVRVSRGQHGKPRYGHKAIIDGPSTIVYSPDKPLKCGARVWIETDESVNVRVE